jgi:hypothetical protein
MTYLIVPQFASAKASSTDPSIVDGPKWNATRVLAGGVKGDILVYDSTQTSKLNGIAAPAAGQFLVSQGVGALPAWSALAWTDVAYSAGNFTTNTGTWTLNSSDYAMSYLVIGKLMILKFFSFGATIASSPNELRVAIPGGYSARAITDVAGVGVWADGSSNVGGSDGRGECALIVHPTYIAAVRYDNFTPSGSGYPASSAFTLFYTAQVALA